jgi:hypothetical protein
MTGEQILPARGGADRDQQAKDVWRELVHLHQLWGKISKITEGDNIRAQACNDANASGQFTRIVQRKNLPWEKIPSQKWRMIQCTSRIVMFRLLSDSISSLTSQS